uniref:TGc domain-containing protein n=1 Tax=Macrostomum lignano TaxID=282301 RepID=A0A1I8FB32_9PLAT
VSLDLLSPGQRFLAPHRQYQQNEEAQAALVVRRGAPFRLMLKFNAELNSGINIIALTILTAVLIKCQVKSKSDSTTLCVQLSAGFDAPVSKYRITKEFVMEDSGMLFLRNPGTWRGPGKPWFFGQFESPVLDCVLLLLLRLPAGLGGVGRPRQSGPRPVSRDQLHRRGRPAGRQLSGNYEDGRSPTEWTGSLKIFRGISHNKRPVMFGQCWVFSGCLTSAGRALGIPTRSVTNFSSAHDTHANLLIDKFYHSTGEPFRDKNSDSIWNFHVWNEMWMTRPNLGKRYNGWQAVDATPQEGEVNVPHDANFIFSEVNACVKRYVSPDNGETWIEAHSDPELSRSFERQDLTNLYKYEEGSSEEQATFERARELARQAGNERLPPPRVSPDGGSRVALLRILPGPDAASSGIVFGQDASVEVAVKNLSDRDRAGSCYCSAKPLRSCQSMPGSTRSLGNEEVDIVIQASLTDTENRVQTLDHVIGILYPDLLIRNDLEFALTDAKFSIEAPGLRSYDLEQKVDDIEPGAEAAATFKVRFYRAGPITLVASFSSKQVTGVFQQASFYHRPACSLGLHCKSPAPALKQVV